MAIDIKEMRNGESNLKKNAQDALNQAVKLGGFRPGQTGS